MDIHQVELTDVQRYLNNNQDRSLEQENSKFTNYMNLITRFRKVDGTTRMLEIGVGTGWFPLICETRGLKCAGLEISPQLVEYVNEMGRKLGLHPEIELGNVENYDLGEQTYDIIIAHSVFEHIEFWEKALQNIFRALRPGGVFLFSSSNRFALVQVEFFLPFYSWLPDRVRYAFRILAQGPDIMKLGIDYNSFTYPQLRRAFRKVGFSGIHDRLELARPSGWKGRLFQFMRQIPGIGRGWLCFCEATVFVCVK